MALERAVTSDLLKLIPTESRPTKAEPEGDPPALCYYCKQPFPTRIAHTLAGYKWAEVCCNCKEKNEASTKAFQRERRQQGFPPRYSGFGFEKCQEFTGNREAIAAAKDWAKGGENLWLYGSPGTGKTHIAAAAALESSYRDVLFVSVAEMLLDFQASVKEHDELEIIKRYFRQGILFDDIAAHRTSDFTLEMLGILLERFYSHNTVGLIFTSNLSPAQILDAMGERIASRLKGLARPIKIEGKDLRFE